MKKVLVFLFIIFIQLTGFTQNTYFTRSGHVYFISHTDVIDIDANNHQLASFLNIETGKIQCAVLNKSFEFSLATAKEHYNESYMESDKFPKITFKGDILNVDSFDLNINGTYSVRVKGDITIKGIKKSIDVKGELKIENQQIIAKSEFELAIADFNITVPRLVEDKVAETVQIIVKIHYNLYEK